jgi:transcription elongation factor Elf1
MPKAIILPETVNGFKIIKELGRCRAGNKNKYLLVNCKGCGKEFETSITSINKIKSCGCKPIRLAKELENEINGFKIVKDLGYSNGSRRAIAICKVCQKEYEVDPNKLIYRKNCGCIKNGSRASDYASSHPRLIQTYKHMMSRCYKENNKCYYLYGERGIKVCDDWKGKPNNFCKWALINGYKDNLSIDRINSNGNYEPNNCRWADAKTQSRNTSRNVLTMELANKIREDKFNMSSIDLSLKYNVSLGTIWNVLKNKSWT